MPSYVKRSVYLKQMQDGGAVNEGGGNDFHSQNLGVRFSPPPPLTSDIWEDALLFRHAPGFFELSAAAVLEWPEIERCFRCAVSKRRKTDRPRQDGAKTVSSFVLMDTTQNAPFFSPRALCALTDFLLSCRSRVPTAPGAARWALRVAGEVLTSNFPLSRPGVLAAIIPPRRDKLPKAPKRAPTFDLGFVKRLEGLPGATSEPFAKRLYSPRSSLWYSNRFTLRTQ